MSFGSQSRPFHRHFSIFGQRFLLVLQQLLDLLQRNVLEMQFRCFLLYSHYIINVAGLDSYGLPL